MAKKVKAKVRVSSIIGDIIKVNVESEIIDVRALKKVGKGNKFFLYVEKRGKFQVEYETDTQVLRFYPYESEGAEFNGHLELSKYVKAIRAAAIHTSNHGLSGTRESNLQKLEG